MTENKNLNSLAALYNTDKLEHGYIKIYEKYFESVRDQKLKILVYTAMLLTKKVLKKHLIKFVKTLVVWIF